MVVLFLGTRIRRRVVGTGTFGCPYCVQPRAYQLLEARTWFHVFWLPLFPVGQAWRSVQCTGCGGEWAPAVLGPSG